MKSNTANSMRQPLTIMLSGRHGAMGQAITQVIEQDHEAIIVAWFDREHGFSGQPVGDVIIDVSHPSRVDAVVDYALAHMRPLLIGTTGLSKSALRTLEKAGQSIPVCWARNFSLGANVLCELAVLAASMLKDMEIRISETHHTRKLDSPSGTALMIQSAIEGAIGGEVAVSAKREGDVIGTHSVSLHGQHETLTLSHEVTDRGVFASGALVLARTMRGLPAGWYQPVDLLGPLLQSTQ